MHSGTESPIASIRRRGRVSGVYISSAMILPVSANLSSRLNASGARPIAWFGFLAALVVIGEHFTTCYVELTFGNKIRRVNGQLGRDRDRVRRLTVVIPAAELIGGAVQRLLGGDLDGMPGARFPIEALRRCVRHSVHNDFQTAHMRGDGNALRLKSVHVLYRVDIA